MSLPNQVKHTPRTNKKKSPCSRSQGTVDFKENTD